MNAQQALEQVPAGDRQLSNRQHPGQTGVISIADSGPGIAADVLPHFEPFSPRAKPVWGWA